MIKPIKKIALFGGTHGNEMTGIHLIKKFLKSPNLTKRSTLEVLSFLANPKAIDLRVRYIDTDLNRCFDKQDLDNLDHGLYEQLLAKTIYQKLQQNKIQFLVDLHSTTSQMGLSIILSDLNPFHLKLVAYLTTIYPDLNILYYQAERENLLLRSSTELGLTIEVGAIPQGVIDATLFIKTEQLIYSLLDYLNKYNQKQIPNFSKKLIFYEVFKTIDYLRDQGDIIAMIHPNLQGKDYHPLSPGDPLFITFEGDVINYQGNSTVYPVFINEAAYYEKGIAMCFTYQREMMVYSNND